MNRTAPCKTCPINEQCKDSAHKKIIHVRKHTHDDSDRDDLTIDDDSMQIYENNVLRHELIHAFMFESGLDVNSHNIEQWARDEEMIDWIAIQMPKIMATYESVINTNDENYVEVSGVGITSYTTKV